MTTVHKASELKTSVGYLVFYIYAISSLLQPPPKSR